MEATQRTEALLKEREADLALVQGEFDKKQREVGGCPASAWLADVRDASVAGLRQVAWFRRLGLLRALSKELLETVHSSTGMVCFCMSASCYRRKSSALGR